MGNNRAYTIFEYTVIGLYDRGVLDLELLNYLGNAHRGTDIDSGGSRDLTTLTESLSLNEVILSVKAPEKYDELRDTYAQLRDDHPEEDEPWLLPEFDVEYDEPLHAAVHAITSDEWGWI